MVRASALLKKVKVRSSQQFDVIAWWQGKGSLWHLKCSHQPPKDVNEMPAHCINGTSPKIPPAEALSSLLSHVCREGGWGTWCVPHLRSRSWASVTGCETAGACGTLRSCISGCILSPPCESRRETGEVSQLSFPLPKRHWQSRDSCHGTCFLLSCKIKISLALQTCLTWEVKLCELPGTSWQCLCLFRFSLLSLP